MRGWAYRARGTPAEVLKFEVDLPQASPESLGPHEVLVQVKYAALFQGTAAMMAMMPHFNDKAWVPENAYSGVIVATGARVEHVAVDDDVFGGFAADVSRKYGGVLAEYVVLPDHVVVRKPRNVSLRDIAGMGAGGVTAMQFVEVTKLKRGDRVLITGASGGTGTLVVQAARAAVGGEGLVVGTCSAANEHLVKELGVHEVIDYKQHPVLHEYLSDQYSSRPFDAIIDMVGEDNSNVKNSSAYLKADGIFVFGGNMPLIHGGGTILEMIRWFIGIKIAQTMPLLLGGMPRKCLMHSGKISKEALDKLVVFIEDGRMRPVLDSVVEMDQVLQGYSKLATSRARGKLIVHVQD
ncbi:uncharacterized protein A1O9_05532 [Exophiala aquamarina CBS 119918]|uniref:Enoyl reductase (ER) domain-containing protein n=1 Tax=Exophiala aquamarina CBS 119918 TaxID=1182545 RepID=A0A072PBW6_9EURO|nr:uncharacterized protein A1O9_05532 [Exophiala aquamarina CBS 119918]KEF57614.1 hypothetical protein A1O9_05532 [Exophiala aquamarina CBS 119918]